MDRLKLDRVMDSDVDMTLSVEELVLLMQCVLTVAEVTGDIYLANLYEKLFLEIEPYGTYDYEDDEVADQ